MKNSIFSRFLGVFAPQGPKKVIFWKKVKLTQNHFFGVFFPKVYDFEDKKTKKHRFEGLNDLRLGWYEKLTTSKIFIFEQKKISIFQFFLDFFFFFCLHILTAYCHPECLFRVFFCWNLTFQVRRAYTGVKNTQWFFFMEVFYFCYQESTLGFLILPDSAGSSNIYIYTYIY